MNDDNRKKKTVNSHARRSRNKSRKNKGNNQVANSNGGTAAVQNRLRMRNSRLVRPKTNTRNILDMGYARCRLDPFNAGTSMGIPDSNAERKLVFDHRGVSDIVVNGSASILITPTLPFGGCIKPDSSTANTISIDGEGITQATTNGLSYSWIPLCWYNDIVPTTNPTLVPGSIGANPISNKCRLAGIGFRLIPTSPAVDIGGIVEVVDSELAVEHTQINSVGATQTNASEGNPQVSGQGTINTMQVDMLQQERVQATVTKTVQMRPETMPQGVLKHAGQYLWQTIDENPVMAISSVEPLRAFHTFGAGPKAGTFGCLYLWDSSFSVKRIRITTPKAVSFRLEIIACVEYVISPSTPFARLATIKPKVDTISVDIVDSAIASMPAAVTPNQNLSVINKLLSVVAKTAPIAGSVFGPTGMAIGSGVAGITDAIANIL